jgi:hypothetical protein
MLRVIFAGFIGGSSPDATVEGARRPLSRWPFPMVAEFLLEASSTGKLATSLSPAAGREQAPLGDALQLAGAEHLPYAAGGKPQNTGGLIGGVEVLSLHGSSITLT